MKLTNKKKLLLASAAMAACASGLLVTTAHAQDSAAGEVSEVIVVGQRKAIQSAQDLKKNSEQIVDSITAVDIGGLPDRSVTEALQRVPGVTIGRTNQPRDVDRLNAEGSGIQIRGLTWVRSELNGRDMFSARGGRAISWEDVTPELFAAVDVYKNPSADIVEGGLGGTVNLRTRMPFDQKGRQLAFSADYTRGDLRKEATPSGSILYSNRFDLPNGGEFGVLLSASNSKLKTSVNTVAVDPYNAHGVGVQSSYNGGSTLNFNGDNSIAGQPLSRVFVPVGVQFRNNLQDRERSGYYAAFQYRPNDNLEFYTTLFRTEAKQTFKDRFAQTSACCSATNNQSFSVAPAAGTTFTFDEDGNFLKGQLVDGGSNGSNNVPNSFLLNLGTRYGEVEDNTNDISGGFNWSNDRWTVNGDLQYVKSHRESTDLTVYNTVTVQGGFGLDLTGGLPKITMTNATSSPSSFNLYAAMDHLDDNDANEYAGKFDVTYAFDDDKLVKDIRLGVRATKREATTRDVAYNWNLISAPWATRVTATADKYTQHQDIVDFGNFFKGDLSVPSLIMPSFDLATNPAVLTKYLNEVVWNGPIPGGGPAYNDGEYGYYPPGGPNGTIPSWSPSGGTYSPFTQGTLMSYMPIWAAPTGSINYWKALDANTAFDGGRGVNRQEEDTAAIYGKVRFGADLPSTWGDGAMSWDGNFGLRVVHSKTDGTGYGTVTAISQGLTQFASPTAATKITFANGESFNLSGGTEYTDVLPSLNLRLKARNNLFLRFAASKNIVRPDFNQLDPSMTVSGTLQSRAATVADGIVNQQTGQPYTQTELDNASTPVVYYTDVAFGFFSGNPNLKPMRANSFDLSGEWYFHGGMLATGVFKKDVYDYIQSVPTLVTIENSAGEKVQAIGTIPQNMGHGEIYGVEFQYQQYYDFLPGALGGLGTEFNATILDSKGTQNTSSSTTDSSQISASKLDLPLEQLSRYTYNATLLYSKYGIDARLAYNWRSRYLMSASASNLMVPVYSKSFGQLDGSVMYAVTPQVKIGVQAVNLLNTKTELQMDQRDSWYLGTQGNFSKSLIQTHSWTVSDRRISFIIRGTF